jgi:hypothetical protein
MEYSSSSCPVELTGEIETISPDLLQAVGEVAGTGRNLEAEDLYVRSMFVTSDKINSQGGRFGKAEMETLCRLIPGAPVLVGHDKSKLPIGRCFKADIVDRDGEPWVKALFYWLKSTTGADDLRRNIDGGIYTECSLGFSFGLPKCSICSGDVRKCSHVPGREYRGATGSKEKCHYQYCDVSSVNEISFVYRGAVPGTSISSQILSGGELNETPHDVTRFASMDSLLVMESDSMLSDFGEYDVEPVYHGIPFAFHRSDGSISVSAPDGWSDFGPVRSMVDMLRGLFAETDSFIATLTCYRGKSRIPVYLFDQVKDSNRLGPVRWRLKVCLDSDCSENLTDGRIDKLKSLGVDIVFRRHLKNEHQLKKALISAPREGLMVVSGDHAAVVRSGSVFRLRVKRVRPTRSGKACYDLSFADESLGEFRSYESSIDAAVGDTLFVQTEIEHLSGSLALRKIRVIDNLRGFFAPDLGIMPRHEDNLSCGKFQLFDLGKGARLLNLSCGDASNWVAFPNFSEKHLREGKTLVGHDIEDPQITDATVRDSGDAELLENSESGMRIGLDGSECSGEFILRKAVIHGEKVELFYRLS